MFIKYDRVIFAVDYGGI